MIKECHSHATHATTKKGIIYNMSRRDVIIHTADHEEPDCLRCEHVCEAGSRHCKHCGPEYGWSEYRREEVVVSDSPEEDDLDDFNPYNPWFW